MTASNRDTAGFSHRRRRLLSAAGAALAAWTPRARAETSVGAPPPSVLPLPDQAPAREGVAKLADVDLYYWDTRGDGPAVVLFHPRTGSGLVWAYQQPALVKAGYRVIGYSRRGFYNSGPGPGDRAGTGADDLYQLLDLLKVDRFHAVSTAAGAFVALDFALSYPDRLLSLVLSCSILNIQGGVYEALANNLQTPGFSAMPAYFRELGPSYRTANPEGTARWRDLEAKSVPGRYVVQGYRNTASLELLGRLKPRTLLIYGDSDLIAPPPIARLFAAAIPGCRLQIFPECGHSAYWERPDLFNRAVLAFLKRRSAV